MENTYEHVRKRINWALLIPLLIVSGVVSLSAHVLTLYSGVPFPTGYPHTGVPRYLDFIVELLGIMFLYSLTRDLFVGKSLFVRWMLLFLLTTTLQERLLRAPLVDTFATTAFRYSVLKDSKALWGVLIATVVIAALDRRLESFRNKLMLALGLSAVLVFLVAPVIDIAYVNLLNHFSYLDRPGLYNFPYPWQLNLPAYILFIEPTVSAAFIYMFAQRYLPKSPTVNILGFALLVAAVRYDILGPFIYPFFAKDLTLPVAMMSRGQFLFEAVTLGVTVAASCRLAVKSPASPSGPR